MIQLDKTPYLELDNYKAPKNIHAFYLAMNDNKKIRVFFWKLKENRGTILLQQGHNEFIEKYYETIQNFIDRGFNVVCFDWRGQGLSDRMTKNEHKQYIESFNIHDDDLTFIIDNLIKKELPGPLIGVGHSMGGCLMLSSLKNNEKKFDGMILSAPMLGFKFNILINIIVFFSNLFLSDDDYLFGSKPNLGKETPFNENELTNDKFRYERTLRLVRKNPKVRLWGITNLWAKAVKTRLRLLKNAKWIEKIELKILIINSVEDKVVSPQFVQNYGKRIKNSILINFKNCGHEIFMETDNKRKLLWNEIDKYIDDLGI